MKTTTSKARRASPRRDPSNTTLTFSLPITLAEAIRELAAAEGAPYRNGFG